MMINDRPIAPVALTDLGWSVACHAGLLMLVALLTFLIVHPPEVGVEAANIAAEFQLLDAPASERAPARAKEQQPSPPSDFPPPAEVAPPQAELAQSQPVLLPKSPDADISYNEKALPTSAPKLSESSRHSRPRSRASAPVKGAREALPDYLRNPPPAYPDPSRLAHEEGVVMLLVDVGSLGTPTEVRLQHSSGYDALDQAAIRAVRAWKFRPATEAGIAVASSVSIPVRFELH
jgi:protein TonB